MSRRFGAREAVRALDLRVNEGDLYGFLGPNGAGKTTAIRCILGLIRRDSGAVEVLGETDPVRQRRELGALVEAPTFHEWLSARTNLEIACAYAGRGDRAAVDLALLRVGLSERAGEAVGRFSLGMKQRLAVARAMVSRPRLLVLDEPTNGLDPRGMREVRDLLRDLVYRDGLTVFVSSHLLGEVQAVCNRVGILEKGSLRAEGKVGDLLGHGPRAGVEVEVGASDRASLLGALAAIRGARHAGEGEEGRVVVALDDLDVPALNRALVEAGVSVDALVPRRKSLEDVYLELTSPEGGLA